MESLREALQLALEQKLDEKRKHVAAKMAGGAQLDEEVKCMAKAIAKKLIKKHEDENHE
jgi:hypothetical protein